MEPPVPHGKEDPVMLSFDTLALLLIGTAIAREAYLRLRRSSQPVPAENT